MTDLLEKAVAAVRQMSADDQDAIAQAMLSMAKIADPPAIEPEHVAVVMAELEQAERSTVVEGEASTNVLRSGLRPRCVCSAINIRVHHASGIEPGSRALWRTA